MIKSMTAFANKEINNGDIQLSWEIRSVNHRYLDANVYLPEGFQEKEAELKELIRKRLGRGKVDAKLVCNLVGSEKQGQIKLNKSVVEGLLAAQKEIEELSSKASVKSVRSLSNIEIISFPGVQDNAEIEYTQYTKAATILFKEVLNSFVQSREEEGARLKEMLETRANNITDIVAKVKNRRPEVIAALREKVIKKLSDLDVEADNSRLEQELVIQAQRLDVDEELDRLNSHIEELTAVLKRDEPIGRRLDFLMQELNREANTLGSKANDAETTKSSVELKVLIEQMREQVMNIE